MKAFSVLAVAAIFLALAIYLKADVFAAVRVIGNYLADFSVVRIVHVPNPFE